MVEPSGHWTGKGASYEKDLSDRSGLRQLRQPYGGGCQETEGVQDAVVNFMTQKMIVEFREGADPKAVMKAVLKNCRKVEDDCEIYL